MDRGDHVAKTQVGLPGNSEDMADFFDARASSYERHMQESVEDCALYYQSIASAIATQRDQPKILDLGIGTGLELDSVFARFPQAQVTGIDLSTGMLRELAQKNRPWLDRVKLITGSFLERDLGCAVYDVVISSMVLHHWIPRVKLELYRRIYRALVPAGLFINGDYVVSEQESQGNLKTFASSQLQDRHLRHIDLPLSLEQEHRLLKEAGFCAIATPFRRDHVVIMAATKDKARAHKVFA